MTENFYRLETYKPNYSIYGGNIDIEDFNTHLPNKRRISNQIDAEHLIHKTINRKEGQEYKNMILNFTLEELRDMKLISNTNGQPTCGLTNEKWQKEFELRKMFITPYSRDIKKYGGKYSRDTGTWNEETQGTYHGCSNWQQYCACINDILKNIRSGQVDYCYFIYQIEDLVKFHYNSLKTKYCDGYWEVWLER